MASGSESAPLPVPTHPRRAPPTATSIDSHVAAAGHAHAIGFLDDMAQVSHEYVLDPVKAYAALEGAAPAGVAAGAPPSSEQDRRCRSAGGGLPMLILAGADDPVTRGMRSVQQICAALKQAGKISAPKVVIPACRTSPPRSSRLGPRCRPLS